MITAIEGGFSIPDKLNLLDVRTTIPIVQIATSTPRLKRIIRTTISVPKSASPTGIAINP